MTVIDAIVFMVLLLVLVLAITSKR